MQLVLYDANRKLIDNRLLKKDEIIRSGAPVQFDAHLVDNLESEWRKEALPDLSEQKIFNADTGELRKGYGNLSCTKVNESIGGGWLTLLMNYFIWLLLLFGSLSPSENI